jgi:hypothetical protein
MKKSSLIALTALAAVALLAPAGSAFAQSSATASATATATIIAPLAMINTADLAFGLVTTSAAAGTIELTPAGVRNSNGGATAITGLAWNAAAFSVTGEVGRTFAITLPASTTIAAGANTMTVNTFTSNLGATGTLTGGVAALNVGATLNVGANQASGSYVGTFNVTVAYN